jgi:hypothetical protein
VKRPRRAAKRSRPRRPGKPAVDAAPVTPAQLRALTREIARRMKAPRVRKAAQGAPLRWNPDPDDVQRSVAQLVLTLVEFLRKLMERQAIRRMEERTLTRRQVDDLGRALMTLEQTIHDMARRFDLAPEDLNLDLGPVGKLM